MFLCAKVMFISAKSCHRRQLSFQESLYHFVPPVPGVADGRVIDGHDLHATATAQGIVAGIDRIAVDSDVVAVLPSLATRHLSPQTVALGDDILRTVLVEHAEESLLRLAILRVRACLARSAHRHLQIVVEQHALPDTLSFRPFGLMPDEARSNFRNVLIQRSRGLSSLR